MILQFIFLHSLPFHCSAKALPKFKLLSYITDFCDISLIRNTERILLRHSQFFTLSAAFIVVVSLCCFGYPHSYVMLSNLALKQCINKTQFLVYGGKLKACLYRSVVSFPKCAWMQPDGLPRRGSSSVKTAFSRILASQALACGSTQRRSCSADLSARGAS